MLLLKQAHALEHHWALEPHSEIWLEKDDLHSSFERCNQYTKRVLFLTRISDIQMSFPLHDCAK
jgi:hypothetical protein